MTDLLTLVNGLWPSSNRNPIGNLGFSYFSPFSLNAPFPMGATELGDKLITIGSVPMVNKLIDRFMAYRLTVSL